MNWVDAGEGKVWVLYLASLQEQSAMDILIVFIAGGIRERWWIGQASAGSMRKGVGFLE